MYNEILTIRADKESTQNKFMKEQYLWWCQYNKIKHISDLLFNEKKVKDIQQYHVIKLVLKIK